VGNAGRGSGAMVEVEVLVSNCVYCGKVAVISQAKQLVLRTERRPEVRGVIWSLQ
jgi:hypothetical protein